MNEHIIDFRNLKQKRTHAEFIGAWSEEDKVCKYYAFPSYAFNAATRWYDETIGGLRALKRWNMLPDRYTVIIVPISNEDLRKFMPLSTPPLEMEVRSNYKNFTLLEMEGQSDNEANQLYKITMGTRSEIVDEKFVQWLFSDMLINSKNDIDDLLEDYDREMEE